MGVKMKKEISRFVFADMLISYLLDEKNHVGINVIPADMEDKQVEKEANIENIIQMYIRGDELSSGFGNGKTLSRTQSTQQLQYLSQDVTQYEDGTEIITWFTNPYDHRVGHVLSHKAGCQGFQIKTIFQNTGREKIVLENLSSFSFGGLTPFEEKEGTGTLYMHRARSWWSAEGRRESGSIEEYHLEPSWSKCAVRVEKFGQTGSMPVKGYFPFIAIEDRKVGVVWAAQIACPSSWQIEVRRRDNGLSVTGGLADYDYGHWAKELHPGEEFETPWAYFTVAQGDVDKVSQRLLTLHRINNTDKSDAMPVLFNEFCTTWGNPCEENIKKILSIMKGKGIDYLVIDAGWYVNDDGDWSMIGDWEISKDKFPNGLKYVIDLIHAAGIKAGIWFEPENCRAGSRISEKKELLLHRNGYPIRTGSRMFLNMCHPEVEQYLQDKVINVLKMYDIDFIKIDYNDSIGIGCDGKESLGEGLRKNMLATQRFFRKIREEKPGIMIETCSSGGHRLEPSMLAMSDLASFSDAHECVSIPIIAANVQRLIMPSQSEIWSVLRKDDSIKRLTYSMVSTMLGVMCLSGDIYDLDEEQWKVVDRAILFYKKYSHIINYGVSSFFGPEIKSYNEPQGWQAVVRYYEKTGETLVIIHTFSREFPKEISVQVEGQEIQSYICSQGNRLQINEGNLFVELKEEFEAIAVALK